MEAVGGSPELEILRVQALGNLGNIYRIHGRYREAKPLLRRALALAEATLGPDHLEVATCCNNLGVLYKYLGRFTAAARLYRRALTLTQGAFGPDPLAVATLYHNLGGLEHARGRYARGEPYARFCQVVDSTSNS
jgi:tetratricopeptide (TPR) repeat protein